MHGKICKKCGNTGSFAKDASAPDGLRSECSKCRSTKARERRQRKKEALVNPAEHTYGVSPLPPGFAIKGVSQFVDGDGAVKAQWIKSVADKDRQTEILMDAMREMLDGYTGMIEAAPLPEHCEDDLCVVMPIGDLHVGMHAWGEETGADHDLKICQRNMQTAVKSLFDTAPKAKQCVIINLGDYFHADNAGNTTTKGTPVDVDGRRIKVVRVGLEIFVNIIREALTHFEDVHVICVTGNHDGESSKMLSLMLSIMFQNEPRVTVETAPHKFHRFRWGKCLLATTHGDTGKDTELPMIMANDWRKDWADCEYYRWYKGHVHHSSLKEYTGKVIVETFQTLTPSDAWHRASGYRSGQSLKIDVWDKEWGHVQRNEIGIRRVEHLNKDEKCTD